MQAQMKELRTLRMADRGEFMDQMTAAGHAKRVAEQEFGREDTRYLAALSRYDLYVQADKDPFGRDV
jgi:hypothetical protein